MENILVSMHHNAARCKQALIRFNNIAIQARAQMAADKEAVGLYKLRVRTYQSKCNMPLRDKFR